MSRSDYLRAVVIGILAVSLIVTISIFGYNKAGPGEVAIRVNLVGDNRGVDEIPLETGRIFYNRFRQDVFVYPTNMQTREYTAREGEQIEFSSKEGLQFTADISFAFSLDASKVPALYVEHRVPIDAIVDGYIRNQVRQAIVEEAENMEAELIYGSGKSVMMSNVRDKLNDRLTSRGFMFDYINFIGSPRAPEQVINAINNQIEATQDAIRAENQLRETEAEARKRIAEAEGLAESAIAKARGDAESIMIRAEAEAEANAILVESLGGPENYVRLRMIDKLGDKIEVIVVPEGSMQVLGLDGLSNK